VLDILQRINIESDSITFVPMLPAKSLVAGMGIRTVVGSTITLKDYI
jgi:hypothetical protein